MRNNNENDKRLRNSIVTASTSLMFIALCVAFGCIIALSKETIDITNFIIIISICSIITVICAGVIGWCQY